MAAGASRATLGKSLEAPSDRRSLSKLRHPAIHSLKQFKRGWWLAALLPKSNTSPILETEQGNLH